MVITDLRHNFIRLILFVFLLAAGCSLVSVRSAGIQDDMDVVIKKISSNREFMYTLKKRRMGKSGFYYIIDLYGRVVYHPQRALIGSNFKTNLFIEKIISRRTGCVKYTLGRRTHYVYFKELNDFEILCFSIISDNLMGGTEDCGSIDSK